MGRVSSRRSRVYYSMHIHRIVDVRRDVFFASDEPWSDFWSEYWKINGAPVGDELKQRIRYQNFEQLYGDKT
jgi:hypothetical protein